MTKHPTKQTKQKLPLQKIAVLSDIHGNLPALEAVIADAQKQGADTFWNLGDFTGYGPFVDEVIDLLFDTCSQQVIGNYDLKVLKFPDKKSKWKKSKDRRKYAAFKWACDHLSKSNAKRLKSLPVSQDVQIGDFNFLLTHGSPEKINELIGPDTPEKRLKEIAKKNPADVIVCGHTHLPFEKKVGSVLFLNPGSVGRPEGKDPRAGYMMLDISNNPPKIEFRRVAYNIERIKSAIHAADLPVDFAKMFSTGQNLAQVDDCIVAALEADMPEYADSLAGVRKFALGCHYEAEHSEQVTRLAQQLYKLLASAHRMNTEELFLLTCASVLHDIGYTGGVKAHHITAMEMIQKDTSMLLDESQRKIVARTARYHRKSVPSDEHPEFAALSEPEQNAVCWLGGILRVADGLDRSHMSLVKGVRINHTEDTVEIHCKSDSPIEAELAAAEKKSDLLADCLGCSVQFLTS